MERKYFEEEVLDYANNRKPKSGESDKPYLII